MLITARVSSRDEHIRETWVRAMETRIVKDMLQTCQRSESVNHYENCRELADKYISMLRENKVRLHQTLSDQDQTQSQVQIQGYKHIDV